MPWDPNKAKLQFELPKELKEELRRLADLEDRSTSAMLRVLIREALEQRELERVRRNRPHFSDS